MDLCNTNCIPCREATTKLTKEEIAEHMKQLTGWNLVWKLPIDAPYEPSLQRSVKLGSFGEALELVNDVGEIAEEEGHHPCMVVNYKEVIFTLHTYKIKHLTINDFILAAKIDEIIADYI